MAKPKNPRSANSSIKPDYKSDYIKFSFKLLDTNNITDYTNSNLLLPCLLDVLKHLKEQSNHTWQECRRAGKHSKCGTEKLHDSCISEKLKNLLESMSIDKDNVVVFRATGNNRVMLAQREGDIANIFYIEVDFNEQIYLH